MDVFTSRPQMPKMYKRRLPMYFDMFPHFGILAERILSPSLCLSLFHFCVPELYFNGDFFSVCLDEWLLVYVIISLDMLNIVPSFIWGFSL